MMYFDASRIQGILLTSFGFVRGISHEVELAIGSWRQRPQHLISHPIYLNGAYGSVPNTTDAEANRGTTLIERARARIADAGHQKPAEDHKVARLRAVKKRLEGIEQVVYGTRYAWASPHVRSSCVVWWFGDFPNYTGVLIFQELFATPRPSQTSHPANSEL